MEKGVRQSGGAARIIIFLPDLGKWQIEGKVGERVVCAWCAL